MALEDTQRTRNDVDVLGISTLTKTIDNYPNIISPFEKEVPYDDMEGANSIWFVNDIGNAETNNLTETDVVYFRFGYEEMEVKNIESLNISFTISSDYPIDLMKVGIIDMVQTYTDVQIAINNTSDIDVSIDISEISNDDIISLISQSKFGIFVELSGGLINSNVIISNMKIVSTFTSLLNEEIAAVKNRLELANINTDTYSKDEIDEKIEDIISGDIDLEGYMKWEDYTDDLGNQTQTSEFLKALDNTIISITGRGDDF